MVSKKRRISKMLPYSNDQLVPVEIPHNPDVALNYLVATITQLWGHLHWVLDLLRFVHILKDLRYLVQVLDVLDLALEELLELELLLAEILPNTLTHQRGLTDTFSFHFGSNRFSIQLDFTGFLR